MKTKRYHLLTRMAGMIVTGLFIAAGVQAQHGHDDHGYNQDGLSTATYTGTVIVDSSYTHPQYFLDSNADGSADYLLMFGPWWYVPESGATRPQDGSAATITGAEMRGMGQGGLTPVIVLEINGLKWRDASALGSHGWNGSSDWRMNGDTLRVSGTVLIDTTYTYAMYFLDTDADSTPEYKLDFGPPWYTPENGLARPQQGENITVLGQRHQSMYGFDMLTVFELNGQEWRPANQPAPWAGRWMYRNHSDSTYVYCLNDSSNWIGFAPGHMGRGMMGGGMNWPDSVFVQFWEIHPDSLPGEHMQGGLKGFYVDMKDPMGNTMMGGSRWGGDDWGGHHGWMNFEKNHQLHFQYSDEDLQRNNLDENTMELRYWDAGTNTWQRAENATIDPASNSITLSSKQLSTYYALAASATTTDIGGTQATPEKFRLLGNYPNPFNPETTIAFELDETAPVRIDIYDLNGTLVASLLHETRGAGSYRMRWDGRDSRGYQLASGVYLLRFQAGRHIAYRPMTLLK